MISYANINLIISGVIHCLLLNEFVNIKFICFLRVLLEYLIVSRTNWFSVSMLIVNPIILREFYEINALILFFFCMNVRLKFQYCVFVMQIKKFYVY